jgi:hypothetical protein
MLMMSIVALLLMALSFVAWIWLLVIIFKRSILGGILSLLFTLPILYFLFTGWGKEGQDIKKPFFASLLFAILSGVIAATALKGAVEEGVEQAVAPPRRPAAATREAPRPAENVRVSNPAPAAPAPAPAVPAAIPAPQPIHVPPPSMQREPPRAESSRPAPKPAPERPKATSSPCVYKPVMTDEDLAKCR